MTKNKLDYKLINIALIAIIIFFLYNSSDLWFGIIDKILKIIIPILLGFVIAYTLYPYLKFLIKHKIPKILGIFIVIFTLISLIIIVISLLIPVLINQIISLTDTIIIFIRDLSLKFDFDFTFLEEKLVTSFDLIIANTSKYISSGAIKTINTSISIITSSFIALISSVYFLIDMDKIRLFIKTKLKEKSRNIYRYISILDHEIKNYLKGFMSIIWISFLEYSILYYIIDHPNALLLGILSGLANLVPCFGGFLVSIVAIMTSLVIGPGLCVKVLILFCVGAILDNFIINPLVYGKSNKVHPIVVITSVFAGGILFGMVGIIISLPVAIMIISSYKFYQSLE